MKHWERVLWLGLGLVLAAAGMVIGRHTVSLPALAGTDRTEDYIMTTGPTALGIGPNMTADGIWILDYRAGKLLGTVVDPTVGKLWPWDEVDLIKEFNIPPKQNVHFMMTTGSTVKGHTALYLAEINTGRFGVYGMTPRGNGAIMIRKFDATVFRRQVIVPDP